MLEQIKTKGIVQVFSFEKKQLVDYSIGNNTLTLDGADYFRRLISGCYSINSNGHVEVDSSGNQLKPVSDLTISHIGLGTCGDNRSYQLDDDILFDPIKSPAVQAPIPANIELGENFFNRSPYYSINNKRYNYMRQLFKISTLRDINLSAYDYVGSDLNLKEGITALNFNEDKTGITFTFVIPERLGNLSQLISSSTGVSTKDSINYNWSTKYYSDSDINAFTTGVYGTSEEDLYQKIEYNELGLYSNDGTLIARKTLSSIKKSLDREIIIKWTIKFNSN